MLLCNDSVTFHIQHFCNYLSCKQSLATAPNLPDFGTWPPHFWGHWISCRQSPLGTPSANTSIYWFPSLARLFSANYQRLCWDSYFSSFSWSPPSSLIAAKSSATTAQPAHPKSISCTTTLTSQVWTSSPLLAQWHAVQSHRRIST